MDGLEERLGYKFRDRDLLRQAMTHPSLSAERSGAGSDNQRLEFLGDAVLQLVLTELLYERLPEEPEGRLTQLRASVVSKPALAACARRLELGPVLRLGKGEDSNQGRERDSNHAAPQRQSMPRFFVRKLATIWRPRFDRNPVARSQYALERSPLVIL